ncbi:MAG: helix-hairpin-helix domain-containing protein [Deltaproteobacteria bacterium]|nr:MAG: helix-hairpin-helix domain-containing protein [Deltaproteobacteria bacterium]
MFAAGRTGAPVDATPCAEPREIGARSGHSTVVACDGPRRGAALRGPARRLFGLGIDPNRADATTLEVLPGIGPSRAAAIVEARSTRPFARVEDLTRVRGIGPVTLARIRALLWIASGPTASCAAPAAPRAALEFEPEVD